MRSRFGENLMRYNELAKQFDAEIEPDNRQLEALNALLDFYAGQAAHTRGTDQKTQRQIFDIQQGKEVVMRKLKADLARLDAPESQPEQLEDLPSVRFDGEIYFVANEHGESAISLGELITDGDWGQRYHLDESAPRGVRKRYLVEQAKWQLQQDLNEQIILDEGHSRFTDTWKQETYQRMADDKETGREHMGLIAEKMVENFLSKLSYDHPEASFSIERANAYQDVEQKIDFIIHRKFRQRGVQVEAVGIAHEGIQFTVNTKQEDLQTKAAQVEKAKRHLPRKANIEDIVLVSLPISRFVETYRTWEKQGRPSGGPDKLWSEAIKEEIFRNVLKGFLAPEEIETEWGAISGNQLETAAA